MFFKNFYFRCHVRKMEDDDIQRCNLGHNQDEIQELKMTTCHNKGLQSVKM